MNKIHILIRALACGILLAANPVNAEFMDRVLVIVNEDVITQSQLDYRVSGVLQEIQSNQAETPPLEELNKQILDVMVSELLQVQEAERRNLTVSDAEIQAAIERFASQQNLTVPQLQATLEQRGESFSRFTQSVSDSLNISRLTEYYTRARVVVPDYEIDGFIAQNDIADGGSEYQIGHILIKDPDTNQDLAQRVRDEIASGLSFEEAVLAYSEATNAQEGGVLGWRTAAQLPEIFAQAIKSVNVGQVTEVLRSENGLHILKLLDLKGDRQEILQHKVRHVLITANTDVARAHATGRLAEIRARILAGEDFEDMARIYSDDAVSAANGGDLDWVSPGDMVAPFENVFSKIALNEISEPFSTSYGVHILQVLDRRTKNVTDQVIRAQADNILRRRRAEREFD
ncbi:MAG: peptidylprolyl isomerase, partial [Acidiferrobacterales bacterium]|nr:peptidylprolyl isomerase [Acidiferrobacterales bacterium]